jgi:hypothetical protein
LFQCEEHIPGCQKALQLWQACAKSNEPRLFVLQNFEGNAANKDSLLEI